MHFILSILLNGLLVFLLAQFLDGVGVESYTVAVITGIVLGLVNAVVKPILKFFTMPITILTLGLFLLVINGAMLLLVDYLVPGFAVDGLGNAILFSVLLLILNCVLGLRK